MDWLDTDLPEVDEEIVAETRRRFEEKQAAKMRRVMGGLDNRIVGVDVDIDDEGKPSGTQPSGKEMTLAEREAKWGFTYDELKAATKVVSVLFSDPSLYLGDPYLAESRLYTMITRDRRTKRENQEVLRQVLNEERGRKEKIKRQQDIATIRKTTMKKEREEALNSLLLTSGPAGGGPLLITGAGADNDIDADDGDAEEKEDDGLSVNEAKAEGANHSAASPEQVPVSSAAPPASAAETNTTTITTTTTTTAQNTINAPSATTTTSTTSTNTTTTDEVPVSAALLDRQLYLRRCLAGVELTDVLHHPRALLPIVALPKDVSEADGSGAVSSYLNDGVLAEVGVGGAKKKKSGVASAEVPTVEAMKIKHGTNNKKGRDERWAKSIAAAAEKEEAERAKRSLTHADVQQWRCYLASLYARFWPPKELSTQMVGAATYADTWPALVPQGLRKLKEAEKKREEEGKEGEEKGTSSLSSSSCTIDDIHHDVCLSTSRLGLFCEALLEELLLLGGQDATTITEITNFIRGGGDDDGPSSHVVNPVDVLTKGLLQTLASSSPLTSNLQMFFAPKISAAKTSNSSFSATFGSLIANASIFPTTPTTVDVLRASILKAAKGDGEENNEETLNNDDNDEAEKGSEGKTSLIALLESLNESLTKTFSSEKNSTTFSSSPSADAILGDAPAETHAALLEVITLMRTPTTEDDTHKKQSVDEKSHSRFWLHLLRLLSKVTAEHWRQYNTVFNAVHDSHNKKKKTPSSSSNTCSDEFLAAAAAADAGENVEDEASGNSAGNSGPFSASSCSSHHHNKGLDEAEASFEDPYAAHPLLARTAYPQLMWAATCYYCSFLYGSLFDRCPNSTCSSYATADSAADGKSTAASVVPIGADIFDGSLELFNGVSLAWLGLPPEAEVDGTILMEEGLFEQARNVSSQQGSREKSGDGGVDSSNVVVGIPYFDAMLFAAPSSGAPTAATGEEEGEREGGGVTGGGASSAHAPSGCIVALRRETSNQLRMNRTQKCHTCKGRYKFLHPFYYSMCRPCSEYNYNKRLITRDLRGKVVLLTGVRIKIGYAMAVSLLRCGATVIGTTRFSMDAIGRFAAEPDYSVWRHRLHLYSLDLRDMWLVTQFCNFISRKFPKLFAIINNAAQTIARTAAYTADLRRIEANPPEPLVREFTQDKTAVEWRQFFMENTSVTVGQSLHLEYHPTQNPIVDGEFTETNTRLRALAAVSSPSPSPASASPTILMPFGTSTAAAHKFSAVAEDFLAKETDEERRARLARDGGDAVTHLTMDEAQLATQMARRSDRYDTFAEESDRREKNSWTMNLHEVHGSEAAEVMAINALSPFILNSRLKPLLMNRDGEEDEAELAAEARAAARRAAVEEAEARAAARRAAVEEAEARSAAAASGGVKSNRALKREAMAQAEGAAKAWNMKKCSRFIINVSAMEGQFYRHKLTTHPHTNMAKAALNMMTRTSAEDYARDGIFMNSVDTGWITDESPATKKQRRADDNMLCPLDEVDAAARCLDLIYTDSREFGKFWKNYKVIPW